MDADSVLQHCLEEIEAGRLTARECAAQYPAFEGLEDELSAAQALRGLPPPVLSRAANKAIEVQLRARASQLEAAKRVARKAGRNSSERNSLARWPRWSLALAALLVLLLIGAGAASAADASVPGDWLYPLERATERVLLAVTPASQRAGLHAAFARERADELVTAIQRDTTEAAPLETAMAEATTELRAAVDAVAQTPADQQVVVLETIQAAVDYQEAALAPVKASLPPEALDDLDRMLRAAQTQRERVQALLLQVRGNGGAPPGQTQVPAGQTHMPPGQTNVPPGLTKVPASQTRTIPGQTRQPPGQTRVPPGQTMVPPGQVKETASPTPDVATSPTGGAAATSTHVPPGQARQTESPTPEPTRTPRPEQGSGSPTDAPGQPNCHAGNPNSPNYCTPTPGTDGTGGGSPSFQTEAAPVEAPPCTTNPGGQPKCEP